MTNLEIVQKVIELGISGKERTKQPDDINKEIEDILDNNEMDSDLIYNVNHVFQIAFAQGENCYENPLVKSILFMYSEK